MSEEGEVEGVSADHWAGGLEDGDLKTTLGGYETQDAFFSAAGIQAPEAPEASDWRDGLDDDLKKAAERFTSPADVLRSNADFRKRESQVRVPGKDATDEDNAAYHKAIGVPETAADYKFTETEGMTDEMKASNEQWAGIFHGMNITQAQADGLGQKVHEIAAQLEEGEKADDAKFVEATEASLKNEWRGEDYDKNVTLANTAFAAITTRAGVPVDDMTTMKMDNGRLLMDDPRMLKVFSVIGRQMSEGSLGPSMSETEVETAEGQLSELRTKQSEAASAGNTKLQNQLYQKEMALISKMQGDKPAVGAGGRSA